ncbi:MAG: outer membrane beta-barrel domain-containing protein [Myxococcales bacterium]|nr:outer membrane beta-barrel domain-containing protein [Myxococcales bacterium]
MALAQTSFEGLDLTDEGEKDKKKVQEPAPPPPKPVEEPRKPLAKYDGPVGERDITQEDRVKSVQRKLYLKKNRFELAPYLGTSVNDPYYLKYNLAVRGAYYLQDTLAISARLALFQMVPSEDVKTAKQNFQSRIFYSVPYWAAMADAELSPIYGKVAIFNSILHFDGYVLAGAGTVYTETSMERGPAIAADMGVGMRFVAKDFIAVNVALINTAYVDQPTGTTRGGVQNLMMLNAGISLFVPFKSTFREAE